MQDDFDNVSGGELLDLVACIRPQKGELSLCFPADKNPDFEEDHHLFEDELWGLVNDSETTIAEYYLFLGALTAIQFINNCLENAHTISEYPYDDILEPIMNLTEEFFDEYADSCVLRKPVPA